MLDFEQFLSSVVRENFHAMVPKEEDRARVVAGAVNVLFGARSALAAQYTQAENQGVAESAHKCAKNEDKKRNTYFAWGDLTHIATKAGISRAHASSVFFRNVRVSQALAEKVSKAAKRHGYDIPVEELKNAKTSLHPAFHGEPLD